MVLHLLTPPGEEPVTSADLREFLRLPADQEEELLLRLIRVAREVIEQHCNLAMLRQSWKLQLDNWPQSGRVALYKSPVISVDKVQGFGTDGSLILFSTEEWRLDEASQPQRIYLSRPQYINIARGLVIELTAGLSLSAENLPEPLRHATLKLATHLFENRNSADAESLVTTLPPMIGQLLSPWVKRGRL